MNNIMIPSHLTAAEQFQHYGTVRPEVIEPMLDAFEWVEEHGSDLECHIQDATDVLPTGECLETVLNELNGILANGADADRIRALIDNVTDLQRDLDEAHARVRLSIKESADIIAKGDF